MEDDTVTESEKLHGLRIQKKENVSLDKEHQDL